MRDPRARKRRPRPRTCCSLSESTLPVAMATMHSAVPIVANAQQHPHAEPLACWSLIGPMMSLGRQSTAAGGCTCA